MIHAKTHYSDDATQTRCGIVLKEERTGFVGIIEATSIPAMVEYAIGKRDTNEMCVECARLA